MEENKQTPIEIFDLMLRKLIKEFNKKCPLVLIITVLEMQLFNMKFSILSDSQPKLKELLETYDYQVDDFFKNKGDKK